MTDPNTIKGAVRRILTRLCIAQSCTNFKRNVGTTLQEQLCVFVCRRLGFLDVFRD